MMSPPRPQPRAARPWYQDAISAIALIALALIGGKTAGRILGPFGGLFYLAITGGMGYFFAKSAWQGLTEERKGE